MSRKEDGQNGHGRSDGGAGKGIETVSCPSCALFLPFRLQKRPRTAGPVPVYVRIEGPDALQGEDAFPEKDDGDETVEAFFDLVSCPE